MVIEACIAGQQAIGLQDGMVIKITGQFAGPVKAFDPEALSSKRSGESAK